jgi:urea transporter
MIVASTTANILFFWLILSIFAPFALRTWFLIGEESLLNHKDVTAMAMPPGKYGLMERI